ncbi:MAG: polymerase sigma-70 factor, subfamily [Actinomycetota bacterium]|jgi:RNA polymerase sigma-70 factor (ECF subfamily)|nr:polymerase sigma-70 factor, subfamily [Actinomycetota bacterium]
MRLPGLSRLGSRSGRDDTPADDVRFAAFVRQTQRGVWQLCAHLVDRQSADDLVQDTFLRAHRSWPTFRGDSSELTWVLSIARRVCADELTGRTRRRALGTALEIAHRTDLAAPSDHAEHIGANALLRELDDDRRAAFVLTQLVGLSYAEVAEVVGCPVGTVRSRVARARADLVELLTAGDADQPATQRR